MSLAALIEASIRHRVVALIGLFVLLVAGAWAALRLPVDAMPDVTTVQVSVMTQAPGLSPVEVERVVTVPVENGLNGLPGATEMRSISRGGLSSVTVVFRDGVDPWFARQMVLERLRTIEGELPATAGTPELAPVSSGLGEIYQFVVRSEHHSPMQLRTMLDWEIVPKLRGVPGVIEVNTMGGDLKQYQVNVDRAKLKLRHLTIQQVVERLKASNVNTGGGYLERNGESYTVRGEGLLTSQHDIEDVVLHTEEDGTPVLVKHVASVRVGAALPYGVITHNGEGEAVTGIVMMLLGANSRDVVTAVGAKIDDIRRQLPPGVELETIYDRSDFVGRTLGTVLKNLIEGVVVVALVLVVLLGTARGALAVVLGIPASMSVALLGMHLFGVTGDLMSLGAIDFGFLVDGPIVILEGVVAATAGRALLGERRADAYLETSRQLARPVAFAVAIIMLVYLPLLTLEGVEGKMFRPMALTMACALFGALVYSVLFFPAVMVFLVPPQQHGHGWLERVAEATSGLVERAMRLRWALLALAVAEFIAATWAFAGAGADFVPRIFEGDAVVTIRRSPSISLDEARKLDLQAERVLRTFPEVRSSLGMTGRAEVAIDPVGNDNTDIFIRLAPPSTWKTAGDFDELSEAIKARVEAEVPGTFVSVSQPIEDKTNEMISGSRADVSVQIIGGDLDELVRLSNEIGEQVKAVQGAGDVRVERVLGQPTISVRVDRRRMARHGVTVDDAFLVLKAAREGIKVGEVYEENRRFDLRVLQPPAEPKASALGDLFVETSSGKSVPLREIVSLAEGDGPAAVRRQDRERTVRIDVNLRGRDLVSWVDEARATVARAVPLPQGVRLEWGGQFENFERASRRLAVVVPSALLLILGMLVAMFRDGRVAAAVFFTLPFALTGGMVGLPLRGLAFSLPAAVGFIALAGISVLNGVVISTQATELLRGGASVDRAVVEGTTRSFRAVITTAAVAALGFLPMAIATGAGAEVQRPLATVVIAGIAFGTLTTLLVFPGLLRLALARPQARPEVTP